MHCWPASRHPISSQHKRDAGYSECLEDRDAVADADECPRDVHNPEPRKHHPSRQERRQAGCVPVELADPPAISATPAKYVQEMALPGNHPGIRDATNPVNRKCWIPVRAKALTFTGGALAIAATFPDIEFLRNTRLVKILNLGPEFIVVGRLCLGLLLLQRQAPRGGVESSWSAKSRSAGVALTGAIRPLDKLDKWWCILLLSHLVWLDERNSRADDARR